MTAIRVIPCLDVNGGRVVKGVNFVNLRDAGDPVELAAKYDQAGADEITFLDISATVEGRDTTMGVVTKTAKAIFVPLTVGGGIRSVDDVNKMLEAGASKVSISTAAFLRPELIDEIAGRFGSEVLTLAVDASRPASAGREPRFEVTTHGGKKPTGIDALAWIKEAEQRGAGEILLTSMDADGVQTGFDVDMLAAAREVTTLPIVASGGAGKVEDFVAAARAGASAVLAASVFHFGKIAISEVKEALVAAGFEVSGS